MTDLFVFGTSQSVASVTLRERMHVDLDDVYALLKELRNGRGLLDEAIPLATCGRMEIYGVTENPDRAVRALRALTCRTTDIGTEELRQHSYVLRGHEAVLHLLRVASGLESVVHGEAQILGQVREALSHEASRKTEGPLLHRLFQRAIGTGKRVRTETSIGRGAASLASASLQVLQREVGGLGGLRTVILGAGETGALLATLLTKAGVTDLTIANRTLSRAEAVARESGARATELTDLPRLARTADLLVGAVTASDRIVTREMIEALGADGPRYFLDLAHPRNFDPAIDDLPERRVFDLQEVFARVEEARAAREAQVPQAEAIVAEEAAVFRQWLKSRANVSVVRAVRSQILEMAQEEAGKHAKGLSPEARESVRQIARSLARSVLHVPTVVLRDADPHTREGRMLLESAAVLFGVEPPPPPDTEEPS